MDDNEPNTFLIKRLIKVNVTVPTKHQNGLKRCRHAKSVTKTIQFSIKNVVGVKKIVTLE